MPESKVASGSVAKLCKDGESLLMMNLARDDDGGVGATFHNLAFPEICSKDVCDLLGIEEIENIVGKNIRIKWGRHRLCIDAIGHHTKDWWVFFSGD